MSKSLSTLLLAVGAFAMVAIGAAVIVLVGLGDGENETVDGPAAATASEQHVYLMNLGMG